MTLSNVLAQVIITLITNTVETDDRMCGLIPSSNGRDWRCGSHDDTNRCALTATERTVTTTVTEKTEVRFPNLRLKPGFTATNGIPYIQPELQPWPAIIQTRELSRDIKRFVRSQEWVEVKPMEPLSFHTNQFMMNGSGIVLDFNSHYTPITNDYFPEVKAALELLKLFRGEQTKNQQQKEPK